MQNNNNKGNVQGNREEQRNKNFQPGQGQSQTKESKSDKYSGKGLGDDEDFSKKESSYDIQEDDEQ